MSNGGAIAQRGFIFQSIIAMIECLERDDWDEIKMEPETKLDKVDFVLRKNGAILSAIQVKSSMNSFSDTSVKRWLEKLIEDEPDAEEYCLYLVGDSFKDDCVEFIEKHNKEIKTVSFKYLQAICNWKLTEYVKATGLSGVVTIDVLDLIDDSLFANIHKNSIEEGPMSRATFEYAFQRALQTKPYPANKSDAVSASEKNKKEYYDYVLEQYKKRHKGNELLGEESLEELYMQPSYYKSKEEFGNVEQLFEEFISEEESGVLWIIGEPGHGKTSMCIKAVADYLLNMRYQQVSGVFWFRLNPHDVPEMVGNQKLTLEKVFSWGFIDSSRDKTIALDEMKGGLVFLDGFDELKSSLEKYDILDNQFHTQVNQLAERYKLHIVVTSRTRALEQVKSCTEEDLKIGNAEIKCKFRDGGSRINDVKMLAPLTDEEQLAWINELIILRNNNGKDASDLELYRQTFYTLQKNEDIKELLEIPILLRMIVQNCFEPSSGNRVELYRNLFDKTLLRQGIEDQRNRLHSIYREIAFRIFVYDGNCAELSKGEFKDITGSDAYLYQYYLHSPETKTETGHDEKTQYRITFLHKSFYQYFLSEFFYEKLLTITDIQGGKDFLKYLWSRRIDKYTLDNLRYSAKDVNIACKCVLGAIKETDAILPDYVNVSDSKEYLGNYAMANNVFWNALSACSYLFQKEASQESWDLTGRIAKLLSNYDCSRIFLRLSSLSYVHLSGARLNGANLSEANMKRIDLSRSHLNGAHLSHANLKGAILSGANLSEADLSDVNLKSAHLSRANLSIANLSHANLGRANLTRTNLRGANLSNTNLRKADLSLADLSLAVLCDADLHNADLHNADLRRAEPRDADLSYANLYDADLRYANLRRADLRYANLINTNLSGANLWKADLNDADLRNAALIGTDLCNADLIRADLRGATLCNAYLRGTNMCSANLSGANLCNADLRSVDLSGADLENAKVSRFQYVYLCEKNVKNLDKIK